MIVNGVDDIFGGGIDSFALLGFGPLHVALGVELGRVFSLAASR